MSVTAGTLTETIAADGTITSLSLKGHVLADVRRAELRTPDFGGIWSAADRRLQVA